MAAQAVGFNFVLGAYPNTAQDIDLVCYGLDMERVHAGSVAAEVIGDKANRERTKCHFIGDSMTSSQPAAKPKFRIAVTVSGARPFPTTVIESTNFTPEAKREFGGKLVEHREARLPGVTRLGRRNPSRAAIYARYNHYTTSTRSPPSFR